MEKFEGKAIFKGVAIGRIMFYGKKENIVKRFKMSDMIRRERKPSSNSKSFTMTQ